MPEVYAGAWIDTGLGTLIERVDQLREMPVGRIAEEMLAFASDRSNWKVLSTALIIRAVEQSLLQEFAAGRVHGTIHTCVGQELIPALLSRTLDAGDIVTSNHRCHGHFIAQTGNWKGLVDEVLGKVGGVCGGIGGSQHLYSPGFFSNGQQGGLLPVASGMALDMAQHAPGSIAVSFIGEGTLGEGVVYETLNFGKLRNLPHLIVCENNFYSQSTPQRSALAGRIGDRARAFGWAVLEADIWSPARLSSAIDEAVEHVRNRRSPAFLVIQCYRLNAHSKGDDQRDLDEVSAFGERDPLSLLLTKHKAFASEYEEWVVRIRDHIKTAHLSMATPIGKYRALAPDVSPSGKWGAAPYPRGEMFLGRIINEFYRSLLVDDKYMFLGEDIADPYGGAFKISQGFSSAFPDRVFSMPISEAAIVGIGIGLALRGKRPIVEIMFADFLPLAFDQIVNNASKFPHMYNGQLACPIIIRTPAGGGRGYGPTHSQSLERFFVGLDQITVVSLNSVLPVDQQLAALRGSQNPVIIFENKLDYSRFQYVPASGFSVTINDFEFPSARIAPTGAPPTVTIVSFGGIARVIADGLAEIFRKTDLVPELIVLGSVCPLDISAVYESCVHTGLLMFVEEGSGFASIGSEMIARMHQLIPGLKSASVGKEPLAIPSAPNLEAEILPSLAVVCEKLRAFDV